jgi:predicted metal-dependent hydrolase
MDGTEEQRSLLEQGRVAFNHGQFFEAHELWEDAWHTLGGGERLAVQGLIQIAAGLLHLQNGRRRPAARLLAKGIEKLGREVLPAAPLLRVDALTREVSLMLKALANSDAFEPDIDSLKL